MGTPYPKASEIERDWLLVDLDGQTVGRAASQIASLLRGKHKPTFAPHMDVGDFVVCINADKVKFTGNKWAEKTYSKYTGYLGNMKHRTAAEMLDKNPEQIIITAVRRMMPRNRLGRSVFQKLKVYAGGEHPHTAQNPKPFELRG